MSHISPTQPMAQLLSAWITALKLNEPPQDSTTAKLEDMRLEHLVIALLDMDGGEAAPLEALSGSEAPLQRNPESFHEALQQTLRQLRLFKLFTRSGNGDYHRSICPAAYNEFTGEHYPEAMARWRADFRAMTPDQQMMTATIVWLYRAGPDSIWLRRVPCTWRASEAMHYMYDGG